MLLPHYLPSHKAGPPEFPIQRIYSWSVYSAIQLPAAISIWESSGFLVLRSENVQLPEGGNLGKLYPPGFSHICDKLASIFKNRRRFQPACCFTAGKSNARRNLLQPVTEFTSVQHMQTKLTPISANGNVLY